MDYSSLPSLVCLYLSPCSYSCSSSTFSLSSLISPPSLNFSASLGQALHPQIQNHLRITLRSLIELPVFEQVWNEEGVGAQLCSIF